MTDLKLGELKRGGVRENDDGTYTAFVRFGVANIHGYLEGVTLEVTARNKLDAIIRLKTQVQCFAETVSYALQDEITPIEQMERLKATPTVTHGTLDSKKEGGEDGRN